MADISKDDILSEDIFSFNLNLPISGIFIRGTLINISAIIQFFEFRRFKTKMSWNTAFDKQVIYTLN